MNYYVQNMGQESGPYDINQLREMLVSTALNSKSMVRTADSESWFPIGQVPGLMSDKSWMVALLLAIFVGSLGIDRFYLGYTGLGIAKLGVCIITCGAGGVIWQLVDLILIIMKKLPDVNGLPLAE